MAHYAFIDNDNIVTEVITGRGEDEVVEGISDWEAFYGEFRGQTCVRTSYNTFGGVHYTTDDEGNRVPSDDQSKALRFNYAGIGFTFDPDKGTDGGFIPPKPYDSWLLVEESCLWTAPVPMPEDGGDYVWDEEAGDWVTADEAV